MASAALSRAVSPFHLALWLPKTMALPPIPGRPGTKGPGEQSPGLGTRKDAHGRPTVAASAIAGYGPASIAAHQLRATHAHITGLAAAEHPGPVSRSLHRVVAMNARRSERCAVSTPSRSTRRVTKASVLH